MTKSVRPIMPAPTEYDESGQGKKGAFFGDSDAGFRVYIRRGVSMPKLEFRVGEKILVSR